MALQFILGNSGSGKTEYLFQRIVHEAAKNPFQNYLVIVPEQFTLQTQKMLVELSANKAIMNIDVLSFKRLAYRVFDELGITSIKVLDETGKNLVLRKIANTEEKNLSVLKSNMNRIGYINEVKSLLSEFVQYNITPEQLRGFAASGKLSPSLSAKLMDISALYEGYNEFMKDRYTTAEELLNVLKGVVEESAILKNCVLAFDEFTGFTPIQHQLLYKLFPMAKDILVTLTIDGEEDFFHSRGMEELFDMPKKCIAALNRIAMDTGVEIKEPVVFKDAAGKRFRASEDMAFLEQNLFRRTYRRKLEEPGDILVYSLRNPADEILRVARRINELVQKEGFRYQELAVVTGDVDTYRNYVEQIFGKYHIPYYVDTTSDMVFHPFVEFMKSALEVLKTDFSCDAVFRFLRTGFVDVENADIDLLENYILATGIRGRKMWSKRFAREARRSDFDLEKIEQLRQGVYALFEPLCEVFSGADATVCDQIKALYRLIVSLSVEQKLRDREKELLLDNQEVRAKEYGQIYQSMMQLLEKYVALLGEEHLKLEEFIEILGAGMDAAKIATIPPAQDSVTIGDIERTRLNNVRVLFFLGVNDGIIPKSATRGGIISQFDREALQQMDVVLAPGTREQSFMQRYYLYLNLTKPREKIEISYSRSDASGKSLRPSYLVGVIKRMFPALREQVFEDLHKALDFSTKEAALDYLVNGDRDADWYQVAHFFLAEGTKEPRAEELMKAGFEHYEDTPISRVVARSIYGDTIRGSVTRLEQFAQCAYKHFLQYGVGLQEREESGFSGLDMGNIYHDAIYQYSRKLQRDEMDWFTVSDEKRVLLAKEAFEEAVLSYPQACIQASNAGMHEIERMERVFQQTVWALTRQVRAGHFVPSEFEITFNEKEDIEALHYDLGEHCSMRLGGRIDRLDLCADEGKVYVKIIDYKSGSTEFDLAKIYQGTQLQLVVYMNAAMELVKKGKPDGVEQGGIFYYHMDDPQIEVTGEMDEESLQTAILKALRPDGVLNADETVIRNMDENFDSESLVIPVKINKSGDFSKSSRVLTGDEFNTVQEYVSMKVEEMGKEIYDGVIRVNPRADGNGKLTAKVCSYCPYQSVCKINSNIPGYHLRKNSAVDKEEIISAMDTEIALHREK